MQGGLKVWPRDVEPRTDRSLERVCLSCLQRHPEDRYPSAAALAEDLERWLNHRDVTTPRRNRLRFVARLLSGLYRPRLLAAVFVLALCGWLVSREVQRAGLDRAELDVSRGQLGSARSQVAQRHALLSWLTPGSGLDGRRERLGSLLGERLYGDLNEPGSSASWDWSTGGRWLGRGYVEGKASGQFLVGWDGWTGERQPGPVRWLDGGETRIFDARMGPHYLELSQQERVKLDVEMIVNEARRTNDPELEKAAGRHVQAARRTHWFPPSAALLIWNMSPERAEGKQFILLPFALYPFTAYLPDNEVIHFFWQPYATPHGTIMRPYGTDILPRGTTPLIHATYDRKSGRWVRLIDSELRVYRPADERSASGPIPPDLARCTALGRPRVLDLCDGPGGPSRTLFLRLSPDGTRLLTVWHLGGTIHVWRMPGSEVGQ